MIFLLLGLAEGNVLLGCLFVEAPSAELALNELIFFGLLEDLPLLFGRLVIVTSCLLDTASQLQRLSLPLRNLLLGLLLLDLLFEEFCLLHEFFRLVGHQPLVLRVELLPLLLEDLSADILMFGNAIRIEGPAASLTALHVLRGIIFPNFYPILTVNLFDTFFLNGVALPGRLPRVLLFLLRPPHRFLVAVLLLIIILLVFLRISFLFIMIILVVGFGLLVDVLIGVGVVSVAGIVLGGLGVIIRILILVTSKIYMAGGVLLELACWRDGAFEE